MLLSQPRLKKVATIGDAHAERRRSGCRGARCAGELRNLRPMMKKTRRDQIGDVDDMALSSVVDHLPLLRPPAAGLRLNISSMRSVTTNAADDVGRAEHHRDEARSVAATRCRLRRARPSPRARRCRGWRWCRTSAACAAWPARGRSARRRGKSPAGRRTLPARRCHPSVDTPTRVTSPHGAIPSSILQDVAAAAGCIRAFVPSCTTSPPLVITVPRTMSSSMLRMKRPSLSINSASRFWMFFEYI